MENDFAKCCQAEKFVAGSEIFPEQNGGKSRFSELSTKEIQELTENAIPATTTKATNFGMRLFNGLVGYLPPHIQRALME